MTRKTVDYPAPRGYPFSAAVWAGDLLYLSGQVGYDMATEKLVAGGAAGQTEKILANVKDVLKAAKKSLDDVVKANVYVVSMEDFPAVNEVYARHFSQPYPARTTVQVAGLPLGARVEMEFIVK
jgi:2-iminobutanoate/2-iminopropanoate deaminase